MSFNTVHDENACAESELSIHDPWHFCTVAQSSYVSESVKQEISYRKNAVICSQSVLCFRCLVTNTEILSHSGVFYF